MDRFLCLILVILTIVFPGLGLCQEAGFFSRLAPCASVQSLDNRVVETGVRAGYKNLALSFNIPAPSTFNGFGSRFNFETFDLSLQDAGLWMGTAFVHLNVRGVQLSAEASGSLRKDATAKMDFAGDVLTFPGAYTSPWTWTAQNLQWGEIDLNAKIPLGCSVQLVGGYRWDKIDFSLRNPRQTNGPVSGVIFYDSERRFGDATANMWIPYFGIAGKTSVFNWSLVGSWFASSRTKAPIRWITFFAPAAATDLSDSRYSLTVDRGRFLEGFAEYTYNPTNPVQLSLWVKGTYFSNKGTGSLTSDADLQDVIIFGTSGAIDVEDALFRTHEAAIGAALQVVF